MSKTKRDDRHWKFRSLLKPIREQYDIHKRFTHEKNIMFKDAVEQIVKNDNGLSDFEIKTLIPEKLGYERNSVARLKVIKRRIEKRSNKHQVREEIRNTNFDEE